MTTPAAVERAWLADALGRAAAGRRLVLVVSPRRGDGKTSLVETIVPILDARGDGRRLVAPWARFAEAQQVRVPDGATVFIDGPPAFDGTALFDVPARRRAVLDGAIIVVRRRRTSAAETERLRDWLVAAGIPVLGVVLNDIDAVPPAGFAGLQPAPAAVVAGLRALAARIYRAAARTVRLPA